MTALLSVPFYINDVVPAPSSYGTEDDVSGRNLEDLLTARCLVHGVLERLLRYSGAMNTRDIFDHDNPTLRLDDHDILPAEYSIQKELITADMLG
jgi:hypothetical protein